MKQKVFSDDKLDLLAGKVLNVLRSVGYLVQHEELAARLRSAGLKESSQGRFLFGEAIVTEFAAFQSARVASAPPPVAPVGKGAPVFGFGNNCSKYYDYPTRQAETGLMKHLEQMCKFAHQEACIGGIVTPIAVTDVPQLVAALESIPVMMKLTDKYPRQYEPYDAVEVPYLVELGDIILGPGEQNRFVGHCDCINPVLRLERRTAAVMIEKARYGVGNLITTMPAAGGNAPVTLDGTVVQATAEIVGGLIIAWILNPDVDHVGYISSGTMDMASAVTTQSSPEVVLVDCGTVELMEHAFGGNTRIGGRTYVSACRPGLQAVFEKMFKAAAYQKYTGVLNYGGNGVLDNGSMISPEQLFLDMEAMTAMHHLHPVDVAEEPIEDLIGEVAAAGRGDFLSTDHTMEHFRGAFWEPTLFKRGDSRSEEEILNVAHERYVDTVNSYTGHEPDEEMIKAVEAVVCRARKELL